MCGSDLFPRLPFPCKRLRFVFHWSRSPVRFRRASLDKRGNCKGDASGLKGVLEYGERFMRVSAIEVFRIQRNNNLDPRGAVRRSPVGPPRPSVTTCHTSITVKRFRSPVVLDGPTRNRQHGMTSAVAAVQPGSERMLQVQEQVVRRAPRSSLMTPEQCAEFPGIKINTLYVMKSGTLPVTQSWTPVAPRLC